MGSENKWAVEYTIVTGKWFLDCKKETMEYAKRVAFMLWADGEQVQAVRVRNVETGEIAWSSEKNDATS